MCNKRAQRHQPLTPTGHTSAAATYVDGKLGDEVGSVQLKDMCQAMAFLPQPGVLAVAAGAGVVGYSIVVDQEGVQFVAPQVR